MKKSLRFRKEGPFWDELKERVNQYFAEKKLPKVGGWVLWTDAIIAMLVYLVPYGLLLAGVVSSWIWAVGLGAVMGIGMALVGSIIMHAANHNTLSKYRRVNKFFSYSMEAIGMSSRVWDVQHNKKHHSYTNIYGFDDDISYAEPSMLHNPFSPGRKSHHRYQHLFAPFAYTLTFILWIFNADFRNTAKYYRQGYFKNKNGEKMSPIKLWAGLVFAKAVYLFLILALPVILGASFGLVALMWVISCMLAGFIMMFVFQMAHVVEDIPMFQPEDITQVSYFEHQVITTANFEARSKWLNKILARAIGGLNYQREHHLFPRSISHIHYPAIAKIVTEVAEKHNIPSVTFPSLRSAARAHIEFLRRNGIGEMHFG